MFQSSRRQDVIAHFDRGAAYQAIHAAFGVSVASLIWQRIKTSLDSHRIVNCRFFIILEISGEYSAWNLHIKDSTILRDLKEDRLQLVEQRFRRCSRFEARKIMSSPRKRPAINNRSHFSSMLATKGRRKMTRGSAFPKSNPRRVVHNTRHRETQ